MYQLEVIYSAKYYPEMDEKLREVIGSYSDCSGMGFGERDNSWYFKTKKAADKAYKAVKKLAKVKAHIIKDED